MTKYYKLENGKKVLITDKDRWLMARPIFVDLILLVVDFVLEKDDQFKKRNCDKCELKEQKL